MHKGMWLLLTAVSVTSLSLATFWFGSSYDDGPATTEAVSNADTADSVGEGIKVHGDWELTVSDPDGSNAMVYNFENALAGSTFDPSLPCWEEPAGVAPKSSTSNASANGKNFRLLHILAVMLADAAISASVRLGTCLAKRSLVLCGCL